MVRGVIDLTAARGGQTFNPYDPVISTTPVLSTHANPALYTLTGGPQFRMRYRSRVQPIARVLFRAARVNLSLDPALEQE